MTRTMSIAVSRFQRADRFGIPTPSAPLYAVVGYSSNLVIAIISSLHCHRSSVDSTVKRIA